MNARFLFLISLGPILVLSNGCTSADGRVTNHRAPGPAVGNAVGYAAGTVAGNVAGAAVGVAEGATVAAKKPFVTERRVVRTWRTETTSDGRTIQVPVDIEVDAQGRPIKPQSAQ